MSKKKLLWTIAILLLITTVVFWNLIAFYLCKLSYLLPSLLKGEEKKIVESYSWNESDKATWVIGVSDLFSQKNRTRCAGFEDMPPLSLILKLTPWNFTSVRGRVEGIFFKATGKKVSQAKLISLHQGKINSLTIENELIVHSIEEAGKESKYDFYLGTYDHGYLLGGTIDEEEVGYEIIAQIDDRIREMEVADIDGDGSNEVLVATHYDGMTAIYYPKKNWEREIIDKEKYGKNNTFNHKVEVGDIDGDGDNDIVCTPSQPNTWEEEQKGVVKLFIQENKSWKTYETKELQKGHIRKIVLYPEQGAILGGVGQRNEPEFREASLIKYKFVNGSLKKVGETFFEGVKHNFYPFLVRSGERDYVIALSSNGLACAMDPRTMEKIFVDSFSSKFEPFYTADVFDYNGDGKEEIAIVHDGKLSIFSVSEKGLKEIEGTKVYKNFESVIVWGVRGLRK